MVKMSGIYEGKLHCQITHEPSQTSMGTDAPADIGGLAQSFSPTDLVAAALGSCIVTSLAIYGERHSKNWSGIRFEVIKEMSPQPDRKIASLNVYIWMPHHLLPEERQICEKIATHCPVHKSLHPSVAIPIKFHWSD